MSSLDQNKPETRAVREPDSLDAVEQVMQEEERRTNNSLEPDSPDWLHLANIVLVLMLFLFLMLAWHIK
jgi:hypothetical protein